MCCFLFAFLLNINAIEIFVTHPSLYFPSKVLPSQHHLFQSLSCESWKDERCLVDLLVVVSVDGLLLLCGPRSEWVLNITVGVLAADHEADLTTWVGWDGGVCVFDSWEDLLAVLLQLGDEWKVEPLVLGWEDSQHGVQIGLPGNVFRADWRAAQIKERRKEKWKTRIPIQKRSSNKT